MRTISSENDDLLISRECPSVSRRRKVDVILIRSRGNFLLRLLLLLHVLAFGFISISVASYPPPPPPSWCLLNFFQSSSATDAMIFYCWWWTTFAPTAAAAPSDNSISCPTDYHRHQTPASAADKVADVFFLSRWLSVGDCSIQGSPMTHAMQRGTGPDRRRTLAKVKSCVHPKNTNLRPNPPPPFHLQYLYLLLVTRLLLHLLLLTPVACQRSVADEGCWDRGRQPTLLLLLRSRKQSPSKPNDERCSLSRWAFATLISPAAAAAAADILISSSSSCSSWCKQAGAEATTPLRAGSIIAA